MKSNTTSFDSFDGSTKDIWSDGLEILKDQHTKSVTQDVLGFLVVAPSDFSGAHEQVKWLFVVWVINSLFLELVYFLHSLLLVAGKSQLLLVTPKDTWSSLDGHLGEQIMEIDNLRLVNDGESTCSLPLSPTMMKKPLCLSLMAFSIRVLILMSTFFFIFEQRFSVVNKFNQSNGIFIKTQPKKYQKIFS
jgi:hypothetical protein